MKIVNKVRIAPHTIEIKTLNSRNLSPFQDRKRLNLCTISPSAKNCMKLFLLEPSPHTPNVPSLKKFEIFKIANLSHPKGKSFVKLSINIFKLTFSRSLAPLAAVSSAYLGQYDPVLHSL